MEGEVQVTALLVRLNLALQQIDKRLKRGRNGSEPYVSGLADDVQGT